MKIHSLVLPAVVFAIVASGSPALAEQTAHRFETTVTRDYALDYLLHLPEGYEADGDPVPLIIFLHGAGERGDNLERVKANGPPRMIARGEHIPAIVVSPQCPKGSWWTEQLPALIGLLDEVVATHNVDPDRVYVTGLSMGGYGAWALGAAQPDRFAAIVPICGGGDFFSAVRLARSSVKIWAFHGDADTVVPPTESRRIVDLIHHRGRSERDVKLTVYPGVHHNAWTPTYADPQMWEWLFRQRRAPENADAR